MRTTLIQQAKRRAVDNDDDSVRPLRWMVLPRLLMENKNETCRKALASETYTLVSIRQRPTSSISD